MLRSNATNPISKFVLFVGVAGCIILTLISAAITPLGVRRVTNDIAIRPTRRAYLSFLSGLKRRTNVPKIIMIIAPNVRYVLAPVLGRVIDAPNTSPSSVSIGSMTVTSVPTNGVLLSVADTPNTFSSANESPLTHAMSGYLPGSCRREILVLYVKIISSPSTISPISHVAGFEPSYVGSETVISVPFF